MKWQGERESENVVERSGGGRGLGGLGGRRISIGGVVIALVASYFLGVNPLTFLGLMTTNDAPAGATAGKAQPASSADPNVRFVKVVVASTEDVWVQQFKRANAQYRMPELVIFKGATATACGKGAAAMGPFYCPGDEKVYIDLAFYETLKTQLGAPGDFAQAYVIAHEVWHHVQKLLGITAKVEAARSRQSEAQANAMSVRLELQADCFAGVWGHDSQQAKGWLQSGDLEEALNAASHIGDDALQRQSRGTVRPESFTHGSSAQRMAWFKRGFDSGQVAQCDTFGSNQ